MYPSLMTCSLCHSLTKSFRYGYYSSYLVCLCSSLTLPFISSRQTTPTSTISIPDNDEHLSHHDQFTATPGSLSCLPDCDARLQEDAATTTPVTERIVQRRNSDSTIRVSCFPVINFFSSTPFSALSTKLSFYLGRRV